MPEIQKENIETVSCKVYLVQQFMRKSVIEIVPLVLHIKMNHYYWVKHYTVNIYNFKIALETQKTNYFLFQNKDQHILKDYHQFHIIPGAY